MSNRYLGGFITSNPVYPTSSVAVGVWTLTQQGQAQSVNNWPVPPIPKTTTVEYLVVAGGGGGGSAIGGGGGAGGFRTATGFSVSPARS